ncbi:MAG: hypothetical protein HY228_01120 [Candidatus Yonathbacteria bacterium]|nr:hypothetical protein [Candidatus Yonathbacteria bacterium]
MNNKQKLPSRAYTIFAILVVGGVWLYARNVTSSSVKNASHFENPAISLIQGTINKEKETPLDDEGRLQALSNEVIPSRGVELPVEIHDLGPKLISAGVIDKEKFLDIYANDAGLKNIAEDLLGGARRGRIIITRTNAPVILNFLWAFGLGNKNKILEEGPMVDPKYNGAGNFASTGGWTLARGNAMEHYSKYEFVTLTAEQQSLVERVSKNIFRPCCGNSTYFPDCNHGMAMLGLLEIMASQGVSEGEMYRSALAVNAYWFPDTYITIAKFLESKGLSYSTFDPKELLNAEYSSGSGYHAIASQVTSVKGGGGSCGVR